MGGFYLSFCCLQKMGFCYNVISKLFHTMPKWRYRVYWRSSTEFLNEHNDELKCVVRTQYSTVQYSTVQYSTVQYSIGKAF